MKRVVILGPRGSGKSTLAKRLGKITGLPVFELDRVFWAPNRQGARGDELRELRQRDELIELQQRIVHQNRWIIDGDLGAYDCVEVRLRAADTIIFLDFSLFRCACQLICQPHALAAFWRSLPFYRRRTIMAAATKHACGAELHVLKNPAELKHYLIHLTHAN